MLYLQLAKPSEREPVRYFSSVEPQLYSAIVGLCVEPGKMCMHDMMAMVTAGRSEHESPPACTRRSLAAARRRVAESLVQVSRFVVRDARPCSRFQQARMNDAARRFSLDAADLRSPVAGGVAAARAHCRRHVRSRRPRRHCAARGGHALSAVGLPVARVDHDHRSQAHRHHVHDPRHHHAAAWLRRRRHDETAAGDGVRWLGRLSQRASLRSDLHRARRDHDLLRRHAAGHRLDELHRAVADRRARRCLPVPQQLQLLDDDRGRGAGDGVAVRR